MAPSAFKKLQDRHVLVIGGTSSIGYAVAEGALADGARVTVASSTQARIDTAVRTLAAQYGPAGAVQGVQGASELPPPNWSVVVFFTGGTEALTKGLAIDMALVRVNTVLPGMVKTDLWKVLPDEQRDHFFADMEKRLPVGAMGRPEDVAEAYLWLMKDRFVTGTMAHSNGGSLII
ncbi:hypothetical protein SPBR_05338 [Sporothrix brasiliensis 5110]|uniref:Uncharacterized protein n=1 Tax=Sporothrix brasiliensis 5110 TaxID=1398154 RepID=A0A0C2F8R0_9PEZI|nr:uncharacterized protein SPBR_05338 [Sporothrix brasiliensis 5110]KIH87453.1 hypothetical protein SPBR_05338 [Sporothrix brasiliensis 5110]